VESRTRRLLALGLGGLLVLTFLTGVVSLITLGRIQAQERLLRARSVERREWLGRLRDGIILSGTLARDYFAAPADPTAPELLRRLQTIERSSLEAVSRKAPLAEAASLRGEIVAYWKVLDLMIDVAGSRRTPGLEAYFRVQLAQRRETMLRIAGRLAEVLDRESWRRDEELARLYAGFRAALGVELVLIIAVGVLVAWIAGLRLLHLEEQARGLSTQLVQAQEQERRSIARELHDGIAQTLSALLLDVGKAGKLEDVAGMRLRLQEIATRTEHTVDAVRSLSLSLRPSMLDDLGLVPALEWQAREVGRNSGVDVQVQAEDSAGELPDAHRTCIYRVAQEALQNCVRHAEAKHVRVGLERGKRSVVLRVEDDGKGFQSRRMRGLGILGMEERTAQLGGRLRVQSEPGRGTVLAAEIPL
jgi:signal transduction histidine kinase